MVIFLSPLFHDSLFLCLAYSPYSHPWTIYHVAISTAPSPFLAGKPLEHLCIVAARLHSCLRWRHLSSFVLTFYLALWSPPISRLRCNAMLRGEAQANNLIKAEIKNTGRREKNTLKTAVRMPEEEHSQMAVRKSKRWCGIVPVPPSRRRIYSTLKGGGVYLEMSSTTQQSRSLTLRITHGGTQSHKLFSQSVFPPA